MTLEKLLEELARKMGLPTLRLNAHGMVRIVFDKTVEVDIEAPLHAPVFHLVTLLGLAPREGREALFGKLLEANVFGHATGGATIAVDLESGEIFLHRSFDRYCTDAEFFVGAFAAFVDAAEEWRAKIAADAAARRPEAAGTEELRKAMLGGGFITA